MKPVLQNANPKANAAKLQQVIQAKYREFQEQQAEGAASKGMPQAKKPSRSSLKSTPSEKTVAPIKIRISARTSSKKKRNDDESTDDRRFY